MTYVHLNFFFDRPFDGDTADAIQRFFSTYLVAWAPHLAIHRAGSLSGEIDATQPGSLYSAVAAVGLERGKLFQELTTKYGPGWRGRGGTARR